MIETDAQPDELRRAARDEAIRQFATRFLSGPQQDLYEELLLTICRLARDSTDRGDLKLLQRSLAELRYGLKIFRPYRDVRKVSIFGSSRTPEGHPDYETAVRFARQIGQRGWMVITGAGDGIMKAGHGGAGREASFGVAIRLPFEQKTNSIIANDEKLVNFRYFFTRKLMFVKEASAVCLCPGGFGTQDEGFEVLTLVQTGKAPMIPIVMLEQKGGTYWPHWLRYVTDELLRTGMISPEDLGLFHIADDVDKAVDYIADFYRVYHSARFVGPELVLRLNRRLSSTTLERLNDEFSGILASGRIEQCEPLPAEDGEYPDKPRLRMTFNKKSFGVLRRCLDVINREPSPPGS